MKKLPTYCPSCDERLIVKRLCCEKCGTEVDGLYPLPLLSRLSHENQLFILQFIKASGSLKEMAALTGVSYPTVRNRLNDIIEQIQTMEKNQETDHE